MSNCIEDLYDYKLVRKCLKCGNIQLKSNFHQSKNRKDGLQPHCKLCRKTYSKKCNPEQCDLEIIRRRKYRFEDPDKFKRYRCNNREKTNQYVKMKKQSDSNLKLAANLRSRTSIAYRYQNLRKTNKTFDLL